MDGNVAENWRKWRRCFENYLIAVNCIAKPPDEHGVYPAANGAIWRRQIALLRHCIGEEVVEIMDQFEFDEDAVPPEDGTRLPGVMDKLEQYFNPQRNLLYEWYIFMSLTQNDGEPIDMFVKRLKTQANKCEFENKKDMMILVRCVFGIQDQKLKSKLLQDRNVTLNHAIDVIRAAEVTRAQLAEINGGGPVTIASISNAERRTDRHSVDHGARKITDCRFCGYDHLKGKCPAYGEKCNKCGGKNHFRKKCTKAQDRKEINTLVSDQQPSMGMKDLFVGMIASDTPFMSSQGWFKSYKVSHDHRTKIINFKIDTGAQANVLPLKHAHELRAEIERSESRLLTYSNQVLPNAGKTKLRIETGNESDHLMFELVDDDVVPILGLKACVDMELVKRVDEVKAEAILDEFADCFQGIGCFDEEHTIRIDPKVRPVINRARRIPLSMTTRVKAELDKMEANHIIERVDQPTEWVNSLVIVEKQDGNIRICLDPRELNKAILREHHHIPTMEDISFRFQGKSIFTIVDMKSGYWHVPLDRKSQLLTTFNTPFGRYCFKRLPFGINSSAEVFEKRVEKVFGDLDVCIYFDDIIVAGVDQEDHDRKLRQLLQRAKECNVKFNRDKIQLNQSEVNYLGHIVSKEGLKPDPEKVRAIENMPNPEDKQGIHRLMGSLNFLGGYIPNIAKETQPLRDLLKKDAAWQWGPIQDQAMTRIKAVLSNEPVLKYFDTTKDVILQVDASKGGLGAVLLQDKHPVAYASRALTAAEENYPQIDKELLAIVYGCEKFHTYTYGREVDVQTDHQPLVSIAQKPLYKASPRLQKLLIRLQRYKIRSVNYIPGKYLYLADTLSRAYLPATENLEDDVVMVHSLVLDDAAREQLESSYSNDRSMDMLKEATLEGWNKWPSKKAAPNEIQAYWYVRDEIYVKDGLLYKGEQLIIPEMQRRAYLKRLHAGHLGMDKCIERAKQSVFWPGMVQQIRDLISSCQTCLRYASNQQQMPLMPHTVPELPWNKVGMDILEFKNKSYVVVVDFYSHYPELRLMRGKTANDVIMALKSIFAVHGIPVEVIADNMPFGSASMLQFAKEWGFNVTTSSPHYPRSNGMAERYVQTIKQFLKKAEFSNSDIYQSLLAYRQTPVAGLPFSPAEMLFSRCIRGPLPYTEERLNPVVVQASNSLVERQAIQKKQHDEKAKQLQPIAEGTNVMIKTPADREWTKGQVVAKTAQPRSYIVMGDQGHLRRTRVHLKPITADSTATESNHGERSTSPNDEIQPPGVTPTDYQRPQPNLEPRRSSRNNQGVLPSKYRDYQMN